MYHQSHSELIMASIRPVLSLCSSCPSHYSNTRSLSFYLISHRLLLFVLSLNSWFSLLSVFDFNVWFSPSNSLYNAKWCHSLLTLCWLKNGKYPFLTAFSLFQYVLYSYNFSGAIRVESFSTAVMQATKNSFPVKELKIELICWLIYWWWNIKNI